ncbi:MAG: 2-succinyl-5-enolpyruvyl-6-hydroxy-3-cyclohexene-1-carboxylic-acid synthase [Chloroflexi bacterium]|nr:MAG: 2-succinyl-5-enolpyruvyl-6-hydroxy-3-cyclohexene-1-carboxylic-acid synthase [Chloroflexota bacterium]
MANQLHNSQFTIHNSQFTIQTSQFKLHNSNFPLPNIRDAKLFTDALISAGLTAVIISPGSRSTPLTLAFAAQDKIKIYRHLDERSAGFFALGLAAAIDKPTALVCTSGTAVANYHPAIIEAHMSQVPLLILTADRPHELRHSGANQTIDQVKIFGDHVLWAVDMPIPQTDAPEAALRNVQTTAVRAYATANGLRKGPVHINFPFRKPLEPAHSEERAANSEPPPDPQRLMTDHGSLILTRSQQEHLTNLINQYEQGLIICGPRCPGGNFAQAVTGLSQVSGYPILADALSGVRFGLHSNGTVISGGYETYLQPTALSMSADEAAQTTHKPSGFPAAPDIVIRFGAVPTSKWLNNYLAHTDIPHRIHIRESGVWADDSHQTTHFIQANAEQACYQLAQKVTPRLSSAWLTKVHETETAVWHSIDKNLTANLTDYTDFMAIMDSVDLMPANGRLFVGNSLSVRHLDQFARPSQTPLNVYANRGASGIDGNISTALGFGAASHSPLVAIMGDITFYHDMNGLLMLKGQGNKQQAEKNLHPAPFPVPYSLFPPTTIIVINNNAGAIFHRLPISQFEPPFTTLFLTPHNLDFEHAAQLYDLDFVRVTDRETFRQTLGESMYNPVPTLIEIVTNGRSDHERRQKLIKMVNG